MSRLSEKLEKREFVITGEVGPPKGTDMKEVLEGAQIMKDRVDAINVTDIQSAAMRVGSLATCKLLKEKNIEPVLQMVCRDRNRLALQSDLLSAAILGIENVLALTGDHTTLGDHPQAKPVFDLDSVHLLQAATKLMQGSDLAGNALQGTPKFFLGAVVTPEADPLEPQIIKMEQKVAAGAKFFQTQAIYDVDKFARFMKEVEYLKVPVLAGIVILKSVGMARYMNNNVAGVFVPENLIEELKKDKESTKQGLTGIEIAGKIIKEVKGLCQGVHIMPLGWDDKVPAILDVAGL